MLSVKFKQARDKQNDLHFEDLKIQAEDEIMIEEDDEPAQIHHQSSSDENSKILKELQKQGVPKLRAPEVVIVDSDEEETTTV